MKSHRIRGMSSRPAQVLRPWWQCPPCSSAGLGLSIRYPWWCFGVPSALCFALAVTLPWLSLGYPDKPWIPLWVLFPSQATAYAVIYLLEAIILTTLLVGAYRQLSIATPLGPALPFLAARPCCLSLLPVTAPRPDRLLIEVCSLLLQPQSSDPT